MRKYLVWVGTEGEKTRRDQLRSVWLYSLCLATCWSASSPGCRYFLFVWLLIGRRPEWTLTHTLHTQTPRKTSCSHSGSEIFLPFLTLRRAHGSPCSPLSADVTGTKWPPTFKPADSLWVDGKSSECEIKAKVLHRNNDVYFPVMKHFKSPSIIWNDSKYVSKSKTQ